jgi:CheY-like chemotaxis protein
MDKKRLTLPKRRRKFIDPCAPLRLSPFSLLIRLRFLSYDLIFLDLQMPVKDGHSANQAIKSSSLAGSPLVCALTAK